MNRVLIVDVSASQSRIMSILLTRAGFDPICVESIDAGKAEAAKLPPGAVIVTAMKLPDGTARELIDWLKTEDYNFPVIAVVDNFETMEIVKVMSGGGAVDIVQRLAIDKQLVENVNKYARPEHIVLTLNNKLIPRISHEWQLIHEKIDAIAATNANAIVFGECGTGKEQIARQIYKSSSRDQKPLTVVEAGSAALVGTHERSSNRSEIYNRIKSYFSKAAGGTMVIKNIHLLPFEKQSVLLYILESEHPDVRVICTAESDLLGMVAEKKFRSNLFFMLRQSDIAVPPLRETAQDIPEIANYFLERYASKTGKERKRLNTSAIKALKAYPWPGNVRELKDIVLFSAFHVKGDVISDTDLNFNISEPPMDDNLSLRNPQKEKALIIEAYHRGESWSEAAKLLGITEKTLLNLRNKYGIDRFCKNLT